jgi:hypothetical protein
MAAPVLLDRHDCFRIGGTYITYIHSLIEHFSALSQEGKKEYKAWIRQEMHRDSTVNSITDLADIINHAFDKVEN